MAFDQSWSVSQATKTAEKAGLHEGEQWKTLGDMNNAAWDTAKGVSKSAIDTSKDYLKFGKDQIDSYQRNWEPLELKQLQDAKTWASPDRMARNRGAAIADQTAAGAAAKTKSEMALRSFGIKPSDGAIMFNNRIADIMTNAGGAAAGTQSDINTEMQQKQLEAQAIQTGLMKPQMGMQGTGVGLTAANAGVNTLLAPIGVRAQTMGTPTQWASIEQQGYKNATDTMLQSAALQQKDAELANSQSSGAGAMVGAGLGFLTKVAPMALSFFGGPAGAVAGGALSAIGTGTGYTYRHGGVVRGFADGGAVDDMDMDEYAGGPDDMDGDEGMYVDPSMSPSGGAVTDDVHAQIDGDPNQPAKINAGEFIMPRDVVMWRGEAWMQKEIKKAREEMAQAHNRPAQPEIRQRPPAGPGQPSQYEVGAAA